LFLLTAGGRKQPNQGHQDDKITLKKVMDMVKIGEHSDLQEMNRKLQLVLEETLTKNMHLQQV
jgi:urease beta subunit